jgi:hypothetical protein
MPNDECRLGRFCFIIVIRTKYIGHRGLLSTGNHFWYDRVGGFVGGKMKSLSLMLLVSYLDRVRFKSVFKSVNITKYSQNI